MTTHTEHDEGPSKAGVGYEGTDISTRPVVVSAFFLVILMLFGFLGGWFFYDQFEALESASRPQPSPVYERHIPTGPRLQASPAETWRRYETNQREHLRSYGWVEKSTGVARVPVDVALRQVAEAGALPDFKARSAPTPAPEAAGEDADAGEAEEGAQP